MIVVIRRVSFGSGIGGLERVAASHARWSSELGEDVTLVTPKAALRGEVPSSMAVLNAPWPLVLPQTRSPLFGLGYVVWCHRVGRLIDQIAAEGDVVVLHGVVAGILTRGRASRLRAATVSIQQGMEEFQPSLLRMPNRVFLRFLARRAKRADAVVATDAALVRAVRSNLGVQPDRVVVIPNAVEDPAKWRSSVATTTVGASTSFDIVSIGRLVHNKGYDLLAEALASLSHRGALPRGWTWTHFGSGPLVAEIERALRPTERLHFQLRSGEGDDVVQATLARANLFVQPSRYEGSSLSTLEAMAAGRTIVATAVGGIPDKIEDGISGYLASPTAESIAEAIVRALGGIDTGIQARRVYQQRFSESAAAAAYSRLYAALRAGKLNIGNADVSQS